jgi:hypothetical protein
VIAALLAWLDKRAAQSAAYDAQALAWVSI